MCFGEHIGQLISESNRTETESSLQKMMAHKMTVDLNMFSTFMKYIIMHNLNRTSIITKDRRTEGLRNPHIMEKPTEPEELRGGVSKSTILSFSARVGNNRLFLTTSRDKRITK
jgi:hypothetical protein